MKGILYGVSVGPGDPELMTLKACRTIQSCGTVAFPQQVRKRDKTADPDGYGLAFRIAEGALPQIRQKKLMPVSFPMTRDQEQLKAAHIQAARRLEEVLEGGEDIAFLTLGDVTIYSTFSYVQKIMEKDGFEVRLVSGVPSFCAAAARLGLPLVLGDQTLEIMPAASILGGGNDSQARRHEEERPADQFEKSQPADQLEEGQPADQLEEDQPAEGRVRVLMKAGRSLKDVKEQLKRQGWSACMAERCGLEGEKIYRSLEEIPEEAGYFSILITSRF